MSRRRRAIGNRTRHRGWVLALTASLLAAAPAPASPGAPGLSATVTPAELTIGSAATVSGRLAAEQGAGGALLALQSEPYPFHGFTTIAHATAAPDGNFSFAALHPDRNAHLQVVVRGRDKAHIEHR